MIQLDALAVMITRNCLFLHLIFVMAIAYHVLIIEGTKELGKVDNTGHLLVMLIYELTAS